MNKLNISSTLEFDSSKLKEVVARLLTLPTELRPTHHSLGEDEVKEPIADHDEFLNALSNQELGPHLTGPNVTYVISCVPNKPLICRSYFEVAYTLIIEFLIHMAFAQPIFGYACVPEERKKRNRVIIKQGANTIESWVGRDPQKYIPGFYWLTLLSEDLVKKHGISLSIVAKTAKEYFELEGTQHLFRFYDSPEDWQTAADVDALCTSLPNVFNVEKIRPELEGAKNFLELHTLTTKWK
jgi:hypothetical protein